jgi:hypothetical protein
MRLTLRIDCLPGHSGWASSAVYFDEGRQLGTGGCDKTVHIYTMDIEELKTIAAARLTRWLLSMNPRLYLLRIGVITYRRYITGDIHHNTSVFSATIPKSILPT